METEQPKENLARTFLEIARSRPKKFKDTTMMFCPQCNERVEHSSIMRGDWEIFTCLPGGHIQPAVRVR